MATENSIGDDASGIVPPHDANQSSPEENAAQGIQLQREFAANIVHENSTLARHIAELATVVFPTVQSDFHWIAAVKAWRGKQPEVPVNPSKRYDTGCKFMVGPDDPIADKLTWKKANRRSHELMAAAWRGVPVGKLGQHLTTVETVAAMVRAFNEFKRTGATRPSVVPGTAQGETKSGRPLVVKVSEKAASMLDADIKAPRRLEAVQHPGADGRAEVEIIGEAADAPVTPAELPLPPGYMRVALIGRREDLKALADHKAADAITCRYEKDKNGKHTFHVLSLSKLSLPLGASMVGGKAGVRAGGKGGAMSDSAPRRAAGPSTPASRA